MTARLIAVSLALPVLALLIAGGGAATSGTSCGNESEIGARLGRVAFLRGGALHVVDLATCEDRIVAPAASAPVRFSPDGRWLAFGEAQVVPALGGALQRPFGREVAGAPHAWAWSPDGRRLAAITKRGGVVLGGPERPTRRLLRDGWGASGLLFAPDGSLVVARSLYLKRRAANYHQEIWLLAGPTYTPRLVFGVRKGVAPPRLATVSPDGGYVFFWLDPLNSASLAADGLPLHVKRTASGAVGPRLAPTLLYDDFSSWCDRRLVIAAGGDRYATYRKRLIVVSWAGPGYGQLWRTRDLSRDARLSWISPACTPDGRQIAASAGRNWIETRFGKEARSIWLLSVDGSIRRRFTSPPKGTTDELPRWTADGRAILFWRTRADGRGSLYAVRADTGRLLGPLAHAGPTENYYGHYGWAFDSDVR